MTNHNQPQCLSLKADNGDILVWYKDDADLFRRVFQFEVLRTPRHPSQPSVHVYADHVRWQVANTVTIRPHTQDTQELWHVVGFIVGARTIGAAGYKAIQSIGVQTLLSNLIDTVGQWVDADRPPIEFAPPVRAEDCVTKSQMDASWTPSYSPSATTETQVIVTTDHVQLSGATVNGVPSPATYTAPINVDGTLGAWTSSEAPTQIGRGVPENQPTVLHDDISPIQDGALITPKLVETAYIRLLHLMARAQEEFERMTPDNCHAVFLVEICRLFPVVLRHMKFANSDCLDFSEPDSVRAVIPVQHGNCVFKDNDVYIDGSVGALEYLRDRHWLGKLLRTLSSLLKYLGDPVNTSRPTGFDFQSLKFRAPSLADYGVADSAAAKTYKWEGSEQALWLLRDLKDRIDSARHNGSAMMTGMNMQVVQQSLLHAFHHMVRTQLMKLPRAARKGPSEEGEYIEVDADGTYHWFPNGKARFDFKPAGTGFAWLSISSGAAASLLVTCSDKDLFWLLTEIHGYLTNYDPKNVNRAKGIETCLRFTSF